MTKIVVVTHGLLANGLLNNAEMIVGHSEDLYSIGFFEGDDPAELTEKIERIVTKNNDPTLILVDILGGTPCNCSAQMLKYKDVEIITGVNTPMLLQMLEDREEKNVKELIRTAKETIKETSVDIREMLKIN